MSFTGKRFKRGFGTVFLSVLLLSFAVGFINFNEFASASPSNFGYTTIGTTGDHAIASSSVKRIQGSYFAMPEDGLAQSMTVALKRAVAGSDRIKLAIYNFSDLSLVASTEERTLSLTTSFAWYTFNFSTRIPLTESEDYLLVAWAEYTGFNIYLAYDTVSLITRYENRVYDGSFPETLSPSSLGSVDSIYCTYSTVGVEVSANPEINPDITVNGTSYTSPFFVDLGANNYTLTAESSKVYGTKAYTFDHWLVNDTDSYETESVTLNITAPTTLEAHYTELSGVFAFYGPFNETTGEQLDENVTVTAHYADDTGIPDYSFILNGGWVYPPDYSVQYFEFLFDDGTTRQYWIDPSEIITDLYVFKATDPTSYVINFLDYTGVLQTYPYVTIKASVNGTLYTVEKRKVDEQNSIAANLILGEKYQLVIGNDEYSFVYGDMLATATTGVQLILRGVDFPKETLLMFKNVVLYGLRDFSSSSISFYYADSLNATTSVNVVFTDSLGTVAYNQTFTADYVNLNWTSAVNATSYQLDVSVVHEEYGDFTWSQYFTNEAGEGPAIFDFSFLGTWTVDMTYLFPAILILFVAACFSALNAEVGAVLTVIVAALLTWIGWIPIPAGFLVAALALAILMALVYNKRRGAVY